MSIEVQVKTAAGNIVTFDVEPNQTIEQVKILIKASGIPLDNQQIMFTTNYVDDGGLTIKSSMQMRKDLLPIIKRNVDPFISEWHIDDFYNELEINEIEIPTVGEFIDAYNKFKNNYFRNYNDNILFGIKSAINNIYRNNSEVQPFGRMHIPIGDVNEYEKFIVRSKMNFGTMTNPKCGICKTNLPAYHAYYKNDILMEDVICIDCSEKYEFVSEEPKGYRLIENKQD